MPLIRTFAGLANGHKDLADLLDYIEAGIGHEEKWICDAVIALTCENPQNPLTGQALWDRLLELFPDSQGLPLLSAVSYKADALKALAADIARNPSIQAFFAKQATTAAMHSDAAAAFVS